MNPSFPGSSGDRQGGPPSMSSAPGQTLPKPSQGAPHGYHTQPSMAQLTHASHHGGSMHPLHGGGGHGSHGSMLHAGPPPLPPPPLTSSLGGPSGSVRSPHHPLPGSILHPPRGPLSAGGLGKPSVSGGMGGGPSGGSSSGANVLMSHQVRMQPQPPQGMNQAGAGGPMGSSSSSSVGMKPGPPSFNVRPPSPRRDGSQGNPHQQQSQQQQQQQASQPIQQYILERPSNEGGESGDYYGHPSSSMAPPRHRELRVEDALLYLDQVKQQFGDQPDIYNQFLDVMKDFKAQAIDTPGVILRVSSLFRGYPNLILGFNTFLPPGYRIRPDTSIEVIPQQMAGTRPVNVASSMFAGANVSVGQQQGASNASMGQVHRPPPVSIPPPPYSPPDMVGNVHHPSKQPTPRQTLAPAPPAQAKSNTHGAQGKQGAAAKKQPKPTIESVRSSTNPVEFDHAIHYVTTIKQRFADEPETYKEFLAILHTYQKEQRSIRQVLDQVSYLFRDHPDLLREFTFFLPDAVQEQAKERLNRAAEKAQLRQEQMAKAAGTKYAGREGYMHGYPQSSSQSSGRRDDGRGMRVDSPSKSGRFNGDDMSGEDSIRKMKSGRDLMKGDAAMYKHQYSQDGSRSNKPMDRLERREKDRDQNKALYTHKRSKRRSYDGKERRDFMALSDILMDKEEWGIFEKIKKILPSRDNWREFLKCLELYSQEVLGRNEMLSLIKNLFGRHTELVDEFDQLLCSHGVQKSTKEIWPFIPLAETDLSQCRRATPSYRGLPASYPIPPCSFRSKLERDVCNDSWVSVPTGSEDFSFKNMRKNQYEEALFKCEDERFEIDMVIDANASTIRVLEPLAREIEALKESDDDKLWTYVVEKDTFRVTHLNAITRIYGEAGAQILELLRKYPAGAIPVIIKRLKQKDEEWRRARQDLNKQWKEVNEKNYHKSLDHSSFYFKQKDKKQTSIKVLLQEAKKKLDTDDKRSSDAKSSSSDAKAAANAPPEPTDIADALRKEQSSSEEKPTEINDEKASSSAPWKPHFSYRFASVQIHKDAFGLLSYAAEKNLGVADKEKVSKVWQSFYFPLFHLEEEWLVRKPKRTTVSLDKSKTLRSGTEVSTEFGEGTVQYFSTEKGYHVVNLPIAQAYLQPSAITIQEASDFPPGLQSLDDPQDASKTQTKNKTTFYGTQQAYVFLRLYQMLHNRLERAFDLCEKAKRNRYRRTINPAARALAHAHHSLNTDASTKEKAGDYQAFLSKLYSLIDGSVDNSKYEDCCRSLMGSTSYFLFTMDKLVTMVLKQMQHMATDDTCQDLLKLFAEQNESKNVTTTEEESAFINSYLNKTKSVYEGEGAFRIEFNPGILRRTPLEPRAMTPSGAGGDENAKIWAPSPRVKQPEPSIWLIEPELAIEYIGSMDEDAEDDDDDESAATPPETPSMTPVYGSPERETSEDNDKQETSETQDNDVEQSGDDSDVGESEDEKSQRKDPVATVLKKRARSASEEGNEVETSLTAVKKVKADDDETEHEDELEEGEEEEGSIEEDNIVPESQDDPMNGGLNDNISAVVRALAEGDHEDEEEEDEELGKAPDAVSPEQKPADMATDEQA